MLEMPCVHPERERPKTARPAKAERAEKFNDCVAIDVKHVHDANMNKYTVLHVVDEAMFYHVTTVVDKADSITSVVTFQNLWVAWAGVPKKIIHHQGGEFQYWFERYLERERGKLRGADRGSMDESGGTARWNLGQHDHGDG